MSPEDQLTAIIRKQMAILGPEIVLMKVRKIPGMQVIDDGMVNEITSDPQEILKQMVTIFQELSVPLVRKTLKDVVIENGAVIS